MCLTGLRHATWWHARWYTQRCSLRCWTCAVFWRQLPLRAPRTLGDLGAGRPAVRPGLGVALLLPFRLFIGRQLASARRLTGFGATFTRTWLREARALVRPHRPLLTASTPRRAAPATLRSARVSLVAFGGLLPANQVVPCLPPRPVQPPAQTGSLLKQLGLVGAVLAR